MILYTKANRDSFRKRKNQSKSTRLLMKKEYQKMIKVLENRKDISDEVKGILIRMNKTNIKELGL
jgi:shikimate kinase